MMTILAPHFDAVYLTQYSHSTRCASADALLSAARQSRGDLPAAFIADPIRAWQAVAADAATDDVICVTGSVFLAGELRPLLLRGRSEE
jgi:dihydrofolate synthase/folylpolyglutamate synthase